MAMRDPNFIRSEARSAALLERFGIDCPSFNVEDVASALGIEVIDGGLTNADARLVRHEGGTGTIRINASVQETGRRRFSIAHEIGHWELHPNVSQGYLCTAGDMRDYSRSPEEAEANWFAATLLMPKLLLPVVLFKNDPGFGVIREIAKGFQTTLTAAARRLVELSKQPVLLISSNNGTVSWVMRSKSAGDYFVRCGSEIPKYSLTAETVAQGIAEGAMEEMDWDIWFPDLRVPDDSELFEEVRYSANYGIALTLLWMPA